MCRDNANEYLIDLSHGLGGGEDTRTQCPRDPGTRGNEVAGCVVVETETQVDEERVPRFLHHVCAKVLGPLAQILVLSVVEAVFQGVQAPTLQGDAS